MPLICGRGGHRMEPRTTIRDTQNCAIWGYPESSPCDSYICILHAEDCLRYDKKSSVSHSSGNAKNLQYLSPTWPARPKEHCVASARRDAAALHAAGCCMAAGRPCGRGGNLTDE